MAAEEAAMETTLPMTNTGSQGARAIMRKHAAPPAARQDAALATGQPAPCTSETTNGVSNRPVLPPPATSALAVAPDLNHLTAITSRKVVPAVSNMPLVTARQRSYL